MRTSTETKDIATALAKAQSEIEAATKDSENPFFKSTYADLTSVVSVARVPLTSHGLSVIQGAMEQPSGWVLVTRLAHTSGQWYETEFPLFLKAKTPQEVGSAITYAKRYSFCAMVGVVTKDEDDDGERAMHAHRITPTHPPIIAPNGKEQPRKADILKATKEDFKLINDMKEALGWDKNIIEEVILERFNLTRENYSQMTKEQAEDLLVYMGKVQHELTNPDFNS